MEDEILADTSILIDLQIGKEKTIRLFDKYKNKINISRITACEFIYGSKNKKEKEINKDFLEKLPIIEVNESISRLSYALLDSYGLGTKIGIADALLAATAIVHNSSFWTTNTRHFKKIKELKIFKP